jgi:hypothetical protein
MTLTTLLPFGEDIDIYNDTPVHMIDNALRLSIMKLFLFFKFPLYVFLLCRAAEIRAYPRPTANPNANGIKTAADSRLNVC